MFRLTLFVITMTGLVACGGGGGSKSNVSNDVEKVEIIAESILDVVEVDDVVVEVVDDVVTEVTDLIDGIGAGELTFFHSEFSAFHTGRASEVPITISGLNDKPYAVSLFGPHPSWLSVDKNGLLSASAPATETSQLLKIRLRVDTSDGSFSSPTISLPLINQEVLLDAHRLLKQATFGVTEESLEEVLTVGVTAWVDEQLAIPLPQAHAQDDSIDAKTHLERMEEIAYEAQPKWYGKPDHNFVANQNYLAREYQNAAMLEKMFDGKDQLRQRAAYALSQQWVASANNIPLNTFTFMIADYYDLLVEHSFGDYREMMAAVTLSPTMGLYLSHQGNRGANDDTAPRPDENYARELQQLFTIGVYQLDDDGLAMLDNRGQPIPAYTQQDVEEMARVLTGLDLVNNREFGYVGDRETDYFAPMEFDSAFYDARPKTLYGTVLEETGTTGTPALDHALDLMFEHKNTSFVIARHMIQRMVSSNPTTEYVKRVAAVFENDGTGRRGNMQAMIRALLLDIEARSPAFGNRGKAQEPALLFTGLARAFNVRSRDGWRSTENEEMNGVYIYRSPQNDLGHWPMRADSVFNFYQDEFSPVGAPFSGQHADGSQIEPVYSPELQLYNFTRNIDFHNAFYTMVRRSVQSAANYAGSYEAANASLTINDNPLMALDYQRALAIFESAMDLEVEADGDYLSRSSNDVDNHGRTPKERGIDAVIDYFDYLFYAEQMPETHINALKSAMNNVDISTDSGVVQMIYTAVYGLSVSSLMREQY